MNVQSPKFAAVRWSICVSRLPIGGEAYDTGADSTNQQFGLTLCQYLPPGRVTAVHGKAGKKVVSENACVRGLPGSDVDFGYATTVVD